MTIRAEASPASLAGREASPPCSVFFRMHGIYALNCSGFAAEIKKRASIHITILSVMYSECLVRVTYYILTIKCLWAFVKFFILLFCLITSSGIIDSPSTIFPFSSSAINFISSKVTGHTFPVPASTELIF